MPMMNIRFTEVLCLQGAVLCASTAQNTPLPLAAWVDIRPFHRVRVIGMASNVPGGTTLTVRIREANTAAGGAPATVATTTITAPLGVNRDLITITEAFEDEFTDGFYYSNFQIEHDNAAAQLLSGIFLGGEGRVKPCDGESWYEGTLTPTPTPTPTPTAA